MSVASYAEGIVRTLTWFETIGYAPTLVELMRTMDEKAMGSKVRTTDDRQHIEELLLAGTVSLRMGRIGFPESIDRIVATIRERDLYQPRKRRRARRVASWLAQLAGVRFVALANTTAIGYARDEGDLDFFVVAHAGTIWTSRLLGGLPFRILGLTPRGRNDRDAICLSYFVTDDALDLSSHELPDGDPYFRYWFLSLLPLYDDGISRDLWDANAKIRERHPFASRWITSPDLRIDRHFHLPTSIFRLLEPLARYLQMRWSPAAIRDRMNRDTTVIVNVRTLKFHVTDGREEYRAAYIEACRKRGIEPY